MLYFRLNTDGKVVQVAHDRIPEGENRAMWIARHEMVDLDYAKRIAAEATELTGTLHVGIDNGSNVWPRFDVAVAPAVGDKVSQGFNGDYYPDGVIVHVTPGTLRQVKTDTGSTYFRHKESGCWRKDGTWSLVPGHRNERNPHF